jgi:uncharacterized iron-regulated membrane protein
LLAFPAVTLLTEERPTPTSSRTALRKWWRRRPIKKSIVWTHRWAALVLGLVLLVICTSGVPLLYTAEINRAAHSGAYDAPSGPTKVSFADAGESIRDRAPGYEPQSIWLTDNVYVAMNYDTGRRVSVNGTTGEVLGDYNANTGVAGSTMNFLVNLHDCLLSCEEYPGYQSWLAAEVPGTGWLGFDGAKVTWGGLLLGVTGLLLLFLALSGAWLWWPGVKRWAVGVRVRLRRGRYARDFDLHQVAGMVAIPLLLVWAVTAMGFEFGFVEKAWYQALPGEKSAEVEFASKKSSAPDVDLGTAQDSAVATAQRLAPDVDGPVGVDLPAKDDKTASYGFWFSDGFDPYAKNQFPGNLGVNVDRHDATRNALTYGSRDQSTAALLYNDYNFTVHAGWLVGTWWRIVWVVLGLVPLLLAVTGLSTWFYKRGVRKQRRRLAATA